MSNKKKREEVTQAQYQTYLKYFEKEQKKLTKYGVKQGMKNPLEFRDFKHAVLVRRSNAKKSKYISRDLAIEHTRLYSAKQMNNLIDNVFPNHDSGDWSFSDEVNNVLYNTDLYDKYADLQKPKVANRDIKVQKMIEEVNKVMKVEGKSGYEREEVFGEAFYGSD